MTFGKKEMLVAALVLGTTGPAWADSNHGHDANTSNQAAANGMGAAGASGASHSNMMDGDHHERMMPMMHAMMQMHAGGMKGPMMGGAGGIGMDMMDRDMMGLMMQGSMSDMPMDAMMRSRMGEFDGDSDGGLSLDEFESLHGAMLHGRMVDRFQHLDADGDGIVSETEIDDAGSRMNSATGIEPDNN